MGSASRISIERRRSRALLIAAGGFAVIVLGTSLPVSDLLSQHSQLNSTSSELSTLTSQNKALEQETKQLSDPATIAAIAKRDYGLVSPGSQAYEILPASGSSSSASSNSGHVPLDGPPVVPGSVQSQQLLGAGAVSISGLLASSSTGSIPSSTSNGHSVQQSSRASAAKVGGFWSRVAHTLEFWR